MTDMVCVLTFNPLPLVNKATVTFVVLQHFISLLFLSGNIEAISLCDIYLGATSQMPFSQSLWRKDTVLEGLKKSNSSFIPINRYVLGIATQRCSEMY